MSWSRRLMKWLAHFSEIQRNQSTRLRRIIMAIAVLFLVGGVIISLRQQPEILKNLDWRPALLIVFIGVPVTVLLNAVEFILSGRMIGVRIPLLRSLEITIIGTAANMLPLPGSTMVRVAGLKTAGAGLTSASGATLLIAVIWLGIAFCYAGIALLLFGLFRLGGLFVFAGTLGLLVGAVASFKLSGKLNVVLQVFVVKLMLVLVDSIITYCCLLALGISGSLIQASCFVIAGVLGSAVSIVPAGFGIREGVSGAIAPLVGFTAPEGFLAATLSRVLAIGVVIPVAVVLLICSRKLKKPQATVAL